MFTLPLADGYRGIWHGQVQGGLPGYDYKYSGGLGTYPQQHSPIAIYAKDADKTFFVYGAAAGDVTADEKNNTLQLHIGEFDHATGKVSRPRILIDRREAWGRTDAHENPTLAMDDEGHLYVAINTHGPARLDSRHGETGAASYIYRSVEPYRVDRFTRIVGDIPLTDEDRGTGGSNFSYANPWWIKGTGDDGGDDGGGLLLLHVKYRSWRERTLAWLTGRADADSPGGFTWSPRRTLAAVEQGHYGVSWRMPDGRGVGVAINFHPNEMVADSDRAGLDSRTNLYYLQRRGLDGVWTTITDEPFIDAPTTREQLAPALVHDYLTEGKLVYLKEVRFDTTGRPVIVYLTSDDYRPGMGGEKMVHTARWDGERWIIRDIATCDHNYDHGTLLIEAEGDEGREVWRLLAPLGPGPQPGHTGGEMRMLVSSDRGETWRVEHRYTGISDVNHTYARPVLGGQPDFAALWADGDPTRVSPSRLYFTNRDGSAVWRLPYHMTQEAARPELVWQSGDGSR